MDVDILGFALAALCAVAPLLLLRYVQQLPVAPACPACRAVTRAEPFRWSLAHVLPLLGTTYRAECTRCGWRGRMRWRWAPKSLRGTNRG